MFRTMTPIFAGSDSNECTRRTPASGEAGWGTPVGWTGLGELYMAGIARTLPKDAGRRGSVGGGLQTRGSIDAPFKPCLWM